MTRNLKPTPTSLRQALEACKEHAKARRNMSVERIADAMGLADHFILYKWISSGRMPANMIRPFEIACGASHASRFICHSAGGLFIGIPNGAKAGPHEIGELQQLTTDAIAALLSFYAGKGERGATLARIAEAMEAFAHHQANVHKFDEPELEGLEFGE